MPGPVSRTSNRSAEPPTESRTFSSTAPWRVNFTAFPRRLTRICRSRAGSATNSGGVSAAIEYAVLALEVKQIVVCGHSDCGAMKALLDPEAHRLDSMPTVSSWLRNAEAARAVTAALHPNACGADAVNALVRQNVLLQLDHLRTHPAVAARVAEQRLLLQGWCYDIATGAIQVFDDRSREPQTLDEALASLRAEEAREQA